MHYAKIKNRLFSLSWLAPLLALSVFSAWARPVTPEEARLVAAAWMAECDGTFGQAGDVGGPEAILDGNGLLLGYAVPIAARGSAIRPPSWSHHAQPPLVGCGSPQIRTKRPGR